MGHRPHSDVALFLSLHNHGSQTVRATDTNDNTDKTHKTINTHKQASLEDRPSGTASRSTQPSQPVETALGPLNYFAVQ